MVLGNNAMAMYVNSMEEWGERFAPAPGDMEWHSLFAESLSNPDQYNYYLDVLCSGTEAEQRAFFLEMKERDVMCGPKKKEAGSDDARHRDRDSGQCKTLAWDRSRSLVLPSCL